MNSSKELLFFFSALGAFNGLILGLYFFDRTYSTNYFRLGLTFRFGKPGKSSYNNKSTAESENSRARTN